MSVKISTKGQIVLPAELRRKHGIEAGKEVEILDFGGEIVIVSVPETRGRGFVKFKRSLDEVVVNYKQEAKEKERERKG